MSDPEVTTNLFVQKTVKINLRNPFKSLMGFTPKIFIKCTPQQTINRLKYA